MHDLPMIMALQVLVVTMLSMIHVFSLSASKLLGVKLPLSSSGLDFGFKYLLTYVGLFYFVPFFVTEYLLNTNRNKRVWSIQLKQNYYQTGLA